LRAFSEKENPDEEHLKLKNQQWILHMEGKSFCRGHIYWIRSPVELLLVEHLTSYEVLLGESICYSGIKLKPA
jgi:hypothetical protein